MGHPLGDVVLLLPSRDTASPDNVTALEAALAARDIASRRVSLGDDPRAVAEREIANGARLLVHCGGQASLVRWLPAVVGTDVVAGVFPGGAANDFAKTFGLDTNPEAAAILLDSPRFLRVDVGVATVEGRETYVFNHAVVGLGAEVAKRLGRSRFGHLLAWYRAMARHRETRYDVDMTFAEYHAPAVEVRLSNGQWAHGGLHAAPTALPDDGAWDVQVWAGSRTLPFSSQPNMLRGEHLPHDDVTQWRQKQAEVVATPPALVAVDDVVVGRTPATFTLLPKALRLKI
jgi:diacylglycerol kinase family enzyme